MKTQAEPENPFKNRTHHADTGQADMSPRNMFAHMLAISSLGSKNQKTPIIFIIRVKWTRSQFLLVSRLLWTNVAY